MKEKWKAEEELVNEEIGGRAGSSQERRKTLGVSPAHPANETAREAYQLYHMEHDMAQKDRPSPTFVKQNANTMFSRGPSAT